jgi:hypothetical protein
MDINRVILLVIDDVRYDHFVSLIDEQGQEDVLPNIRKLRKNSIRGKSKTTFPSVTIPAHVSIMTGVYQDTYKVPFMHWYDRRHKNIKNYSSNTQAFEIYKDIGKAITLHERIEGKTANIFEPIHRGTTYNYPGKLKSIIKYIYYRYLSDLNKSNLIVPRRILKIYQNPKKFLDQDNNEPPKFIAGWFLATDLLLHNFGWKSEEYINGMKSVDESIGILVDGLKELNYLDDTCIIIVSDHGNYTAKELYNPQPYFAKNDLYPLKPSKNKGDYDIGDGSVLAFYFSGDTNIHPKAESALRNYKNKIDVIDVVKNLKGIKWLAYRNDKNTLTKGTITFTRKINGRWEKAYFHYFNEKVRYEPEDIDLLGYYDNGSIPDWLDHNKYYTMDEWLKYTHELDFPMFPDQIYRNFNNPNSCDLFASSMAEIVYNSVHGKVMKNFHVYAHDVALKCSMQVPLMIYNPNFDEIKLEYSKVSDIATTILKILNEYIPNYLPGVNLIDKAYK